MASVILPTHETRPVSLELLGAIRHGEIGVAAAYGVVLASMRTAAVRLAECDGGRPAGGRTA